MSIQVLCPFKKSNYLFCGVVLFLYFERSLKMLNHFFLPSSFLMRNQLLLYHYSPAETVPFFFLLAAFKGAFPLSLSCSSLIMMYLALVFFLFVLLSIY